jgi:hypothetical protein
MIHSGASIESGHYYSYVRERYYKKINNSLDYEVREYGRWMCFDDEKVSIVENHILRKEDFFGGEVEETEETRKLKRMGLKNDAFFLQKTGNLLFYERIRLEDVVDNIGDINEEVKIKNPNNIKNYLCKKFWKFINEEEMKNEDDNEILSVDILNNIANLFEDITENLNEFKNTHDSLNIPFKFSIYCLNDNNNNNIDYCLVWTWTIFFLSFNSSFLQKKKKLEKNLNHLKRITKEDNLFFIRLLLYFLKGKDSYDLIPSPLDKNKVLSLFSSSSSSISTLYNKCLKEKNEENDLILDFIIEGLKSLIKSNGINLDFIMELYFKFVRD